MDTTRFARRALALATLASGCAPMGGAGLLQRPNAAMRPADSRAAIGYGELAGVVIDSATGQPIPNVLLFATTDTAVGAAATPWRATTDANGRFLLTDVPAGWRVIEARGVGYARERRTVVIRRGQRDTIWVQLRTGTALLDEQRRLLSVPTNVTPCRPPDVSSAWLVNALAEGLAADAGAPAPPAEEIRLITRPATCRRAIEAWERHVGKPLHEAQVYLFDLGGRGFALYDPVESVGTNAVVVPVFDRGYRVIRVLTM
jgi:hypothetical protein